MKLGDYAVTEAGFGGDLGAEKFLDIKCRMAGLKPSAVVVVATVRALKMHGGLTKTELGAENLDALEAGLPNLLRHVSNMTERLSSARASWRSTVSRPTRSVSSRLVER